MNIQANGNTQQIAQTLMNSGVSGPSAVAEQAGGVETAERFSSITNGDGKSLLDMRGELQGAVRDAIENYDGSGDLQSTVKDALNSTLEANGFEPSEVKSAMQDAGFDPSQRMEARSSFAAALEGLDPASILESGGTAENVVQSFLEQLGSGANLDVEI